MTIYIMPAMKELGASILRDPWGTFGKIFSRSSWKRFMHALRNPDEAGIRVDRPWQDTGKIRQRQYKSYNEYLRHQAGKLALSFDHLRENENRAYGDFKVRFETCDELNDKRVVVCLAARLGTEVRAFRDLGHFAVGIDLEPGAQNPFVLYGDFHNLAFKDDSVDAVYCNALDHAFDLDKVLAEISRILVPGGIFIADVVNGYEEGHVADNFDCTHWPRAETFVALLAEKSGLTLSSTRNLADIGDASWNQAVFRKL